MGCLPILTVYVDFLTGIDYFPDKPGTSAKKLKGGEKNEGCRF
jgi:hypothetical protein